VGIILFVSPVINKKEAFGKLSKRNGLFRKYKIEKVELLHLPAWLFSIWLELKNQNQVHETVFIDAIEGHIAFLKDVQMSPNPPKNIRLPNFKINPDQAQQLVRDEFHRLLMQKNLKNKANASIKSMQLQNKIYYPYWIGYFRKKGAWDFKVIDGVSGELQGLKMKSVFINLLFHTSWASITGESSDEK
jgi:hypothetical protein